MAELKRYTTFTCTVTPLLHCGWSGSLHEVLVCSGYYIAGGAIPGGPCSRKPAALQWWDVGNPGSWWPQCVWRLYQLLPSHGKNLLFPGYVCCEWSARDTGILYSAFSAQSILYIVCNANMYVWQVKLEMLHGWCWSLTWCRAASWPLLQRA